MPLTKKKILKISTFFKSFLRFSVKKNHFQSIKGDLFDFLVLWNFMVFLHGATFLQKKIQLVKA